MKPNISIIVSTYNSPEWLEKVIWGFSVQNYKHFELIIADDGSTEETADLINKLQPKVDFPIVHVWHPDNGFQKTIILNKAVKQSVTDYIIMTDGDCIPRKDFVEVHEKMRKPNVFLSGGYHKLPMNLSKLISKKDILSGTCFDVKWLMKNGMKASFKNNKLNAKGFKSAFLNFITPTTPSWNGHNSSAWKKDILAVNGFDERMEYGGEDRELGERLTNNNVKGKQIRYSTTCIHLDHARGYVNEKALAINKQIREQTKQNKSIWTDYGIKKDR
ncbi:MAG TPA: glycosyltransferase family 2 protein [Flavobacterium sp.]|nr:glycosyltransferase family 2 protein [Flavobacterium sp.]